MANVLSDWIAALVSELATQFPSAEVRAGRRQGVSRDRDRISVFADPVAQGHMSDRIVVGTPRVLVRYWKRRPELKPRQQPVSPTVLEQARYDLETFLQTRQTALAVSGLWYFLVESAAIDEDPDEWGVEVRLQGYGRNVAAIPA